MKKTPFRILKLKSGDDVIAKLIAKIERQDSTRKTDVS